MYTKKIVVSCNSNLTEYFVVLLDRFGNYYNKNFHQKFSLRYLTKNRLDLSLLVSTKFLISTFTLSMG